MALIADIFEEAEEGASLSPASCTQAFQGASFEAVEGVSFESVVKSGTKIVRV